MKTIFDLVYSIGQDCACATYMARYRLRTYSGPFDWLTTPFVDDDFQRRIQHILVEFNDFWNPNDFKYLPKNPNIFNDEKCDYYENVKTGYYYYHDFLTGTPFEEILPKVKEKYLRRIDRFYKKIRENKHVLLVWFSHYSSTDNDLQLDLCNKICEKFNKPINFLIIEHDENVPLGEINKIILAPYVTKYNLYSQKLDENDNPTTLGQEDICGKIFEQYKLSFFSKFKRMLNGKKHSLINKIKQFRLKVANNKRSFLGGKTNQKHTRNIKC